MSDEQRDVASEAGAEPGAWHDEDAFWREFELAIFTDKHWREAPQEVSDVLELSGAGAGAGSRVLDLCCGPGRHALELARRGCFVTGVDRNARFLQQAGEAALREGLQLELVEQDMRAFSRPRGFELAINLYTSFSYFADPAEERRVLELVRESLEAGGRFVLDLMSKEVLSRIFLEREWQPLADGTLWLQQRRLAPDWRWVESRWLLIRPDGARFERTVVTRLYAATELVAMLEVAGFASVEVYGSLRGEPYDQHADRLVLLARR